jgi:putative Holliday junction resolvase
LTVTSYKEERVSKMGRIIGIDYGKKRVGLAVTDPLRIIATPLDTVHINDFDTFIDDYMKSEQIDEFVVGYPVQMNNKPSESVIVIDPFIRKLRKKFPEKPVHLADERFTSKIAIRAMIEGGLKKKNRQDKNIVDKVSAALILQWWLDRKKMID